MDIVINNVTYSFGRLPARAQFHIARRLAPFLSAIAGENGSSDWSALPKIISDMSDENADYVLFGLLECVSRKLDNGTGYAPVAVDKNIMYSDITLDVMLRLAVESLKQNLGNFTSALRSK